MAAKKDSSIAAPVVSDKKKALETAMQQIEKTYGKGSIMRYGDNVQPNVEAIPTGSLALDLALGIGGVPRGRIIEIYGPESSGKTTLALHVLAQAQKMGGEVAFVDAEHALDPTYARALGVKIEDMLISQPDTGEQALEITEALVRSGAIDVVVVDSVAALVPRAEIEGEMGDSFVGLHARLMSQALRKLTGIIAKTNTVVIFINQLREKVGVMYGNPEVTTGGRALKYYASVRIDIRRVEGLKDSSGQYLWQPALHEGGFDTLLGKRIYTSPYAPELAAGQKTVAFGDFNYYWIGDRLGITFKRLNERFAETGQIGFIASKRLDGKLILPEAIKVLQQKGSASSGG